jgi:ubiquinol-cytochrome c reductase iron-sulfur subunit
LVRALGRRLFAVLLILIGRRGRARSERKAKTEREASLPTVARRDVEARPHAEVAVFGLLVAASACAVGFSVFYVVNDNTQLLGLALGLSFVLLGAASITAGKRIAPQETAAEERPALVAREAEEDVDLIVGHGAEGISRRRLLVAGVGGAAAALGTALVVPVASLGPRIDEEIEQTPWRRGRRLVDERGLPLNADDIAPRALFTAFPEGAERRELGAALALVKLPPEELALPPGREGWAPEGIVAFSKICTHAGCAVSLYRTPLFEPTSRSPALVCPCHYSTFDVRRGAKVIFGPAGRPLPQLPLAIDSSRNLVAKGGFSGPPGPAWLSVRRT